jgi:hypothetical protein
VAHSAPSAGPQSRSARNAELQPGGLACQREAPVEPVLDCGRGRGIRTHEAPFFDAFPVVPVQSARAATRRTSFPPGAPRAGRQAGWSRLDLRNGAAPPVRSSTRWAGQRNAPRSAPLRFPPAEGHQRRSWVNTRCGTVGTPKRRLQPAGGPPGTAFGPDTAMPAAWPGSAAPPREQRVPGAVSRRPGRSSLWIRCGLPICRADAAWGLLR